MYCNPQTIVDYLFIVCIKHHRALILLIIKIIFTISIHSKNYHYLLRSLTSIWFKIFLSHSEIKKKLYIFSGNAKWNILLQAVSRTDREVIARLRNCILALAASKMLLFDTSIFYAYEESLKYQVNNCLFRYHWPLSLTLQL